MSLKNVATKLEEGGGGLGPLEKFLIRQSERREKRKTSDAYRAQKLLLAN